MRRHPDSIKNPERLVWVEGVPVRRPSHITGTGTIDDPFMPANDADSPGRIAAFTRLAACVGQKPYCYRSVDGSLVFSFPGTDHVITLRTREQIDAFRKEMEQILCHGPATIPFIGIRSTGKQHPEDPPPPRESSARRGA